MLTERWEIRHLHLFCGLGGGAKGFSRGCARVGNLEAHFRCLGGIDVDAGAVKGFERMTGVKGTLLDLFDREFPLYCLRRSQAGKFLHEDGGTGAPRARTQH